MDMVSEFKRGLYAVLNNILFIVKRFGTPGSTRGIES